jgi:hypothetical protein
MILVHPQYGPHNGQLSIIIAFHVIAHSTIMVSFDFSVNSVPDDHIAV